MIARAMVAQPTGTVTFLFTDIEGSTRRWDEHAAGMSRALAEHDAVLRHAVESHHGHVFKTVGDAFCAAFTTAHDAVDAAVAAQRALAAQAWGDVGPLLVRVAIHTGTAEVRDDDYFGPTLNRVARLLSSAHGGQVLLSEVATSLVRERLSPEVDLLDLGEHRLKDLQRPERIYQLVANGLPDRFPPLRSLTTRPNNLPAQATSLVGREAHAKTVFERLSRPQERWLTLLGPGGTGKTRLALAAAAEALDLFEHGVFFVALEPLADPELVPSAIAQALGLREVPGTDLSSTLAQHLAGSEVLLVLDNFEHVSSGAVAVAALLAVCPRVKVLATSRVALRVSSEHEYAVPPLLLPDPPPPTDPEELTLYEGVRLFVDRARAVKPDFSVTNENAPAVAEICYRLDGLPLAIELAAARVRLLTPQAMLSRLERRLSLLTGGARDLPARQQTLRGAIDWSYDLLDEGEKALFRALSVFAGGGALQTVEALCGALGFGTDVIDGLDSLVSKSLLRQEEHGTEPRFSMLSTIREYALEQLSSHHEELAAAETAHAQHFLTLAIAAREALLGPLQQEWCLRLDAEQDNLRAAFETFARRRDGDAALQLSSGLERYCRIRGQLTESRARLTESLELCEGLTIEPITRARALGSAGILAGMQGQLDAARPLFRAALEQYRLAGDGRGQAQTLNSLGNLALYEADVHGATELFRESLEWFERHGEARNAAGVRLNLGILSLFDDNPEQALSLLQPLVPTFRSYQDTLLVTDALCYLSMALHHSGSGANALAARTTCAEALSLAVELGNKGEIALALEAAAVVSSSRPEESLVLAGAAAALRAEAREPLSPTHKVSLERWLRHARERLAADVRDAAWARGEAALTNDVVAAALTALRTE